MPAVEINRGDADWLSAELRPSQREKPNPKTLWQIAVTAHWAMPDRIDPVAAPSGPIQSRANEISTPGPTFGSIFVANSPPTQLTLSMGRTTF
jgi:hypothetical protein